ncbi:MAG: MFS transporter [Solirubrobacterales bacterium]|nr:MFS transporter [Solirubrobacterales bacterium]OJU93371.1 MAG: MFS transporter [Solirubrobacterales bacterium 67-14]
MTRTRWITLTVVAAATAMLLLDVTIVYVALPAIQQDLGAGFGEMQWVIDAYTVTLAASLLGAGTLADRYGRARIFALGLLVFTACSAICGLADSAVALNLARGAQGIGAAAMFAASLAILANEFQGRERGFALGIWGAVTGASLAIGPLLGGLLVDGLGWRWIFLINLPIGLLLTGLTLKVLPDSAKRNPRPADPIGISLFAAASLLFVFGLIRGNEDGWASPPIVASLAAAVILFAAFVAFERHSRAPMLDFALFRIRAFSGTALIAFSQSVAIYPLLLFLAIYFQAALGMTPTETGLRLMPMTVAIFVVAPISGKLTSRLPLRVPLGLGLLLLGLGLLLMRGVDATDAWTALLPGMAVGGIAIGMISPALAAAMVSVLPVEESGLSSGINNTFRQLGIAFGVAGLGAIFDYRPGISSPEQIVSGLHSVALVAAVIAIGAAVVGWLMLGGHRATPQPAESDAIATGESAAAGG